MESELAVRVRGDYIHVVLCLVVVSHVASKETIGKVMSALTDK